MGRQSVKSQKESFGTVLIDFFLNHSDRFYSAVNDYLVEQGRTQTRGLMGRGMALCLCLKVRSQSRAIGLGHLSEGYRSNLRSFLYENSEVSLKIGQRNARFCPFCKLSDTASPANAPSIRPSHRAVPLPISPLAC